MLTNIENNGEKSDETDKSIVEHMKKILHDTRIYLLSLTVEPICVLIYFGWVFGNTIQSPGLYRRVCEIYYMDDPNVDCYHIDKDHVENNVQRHASLWTLYNALAYLVPAIFADTILGAYGDKHGRKINILLGIAGIAFSEFGYMLTLSDSVHTPYWTTLVFGIFTGATGYIALIPVSCNAYLADITADPDLLTIRSGILSMIQGFSCVIGGYSAALVGNIAIAKAMDVELATYLLALLYTLWRIPQRPGIRELERRSRARTSSRSSSKSKQDAILTHLKEVWQLLKDGWHAYTRKRIGHRRSFMFITAIVLMLTYTTSLETRTSGVINSYLFRRTDTNSFDWNSTDLGFWNGTGYLVLILGTMFGLYFFKKVLKFHETTLILIGILSSSLRTAIIGLAKEDWMLYVAQFVGCFGGLIQPAVVSYIVQIVPYEEVGRAFSLFGIGANFAYIITNAIYSPIYSATEAWFPGFLFIIITAIQAIAGLAMLWVHFKSKSEGIGKPKEQKRDIQKAISEIGSEPHDDGVFFTHNSRPDKHLTIYDHALERDQLKVDELWGSMSDDGRERMGSFF
uniref:Uncharacterized protein n=1 Tax=Acrobeloides nanus TaxID=290746 RepID=A0A914EM42_9BILA